MSEDREEYHDWSTPEASKKTIERRFQEVLRNNAVVSVTMKFSNRLNIPELEWLKFCIIQLDRVNRDLVKLAKLAPPASVPLGYAFAGMLPSGHQLDVANQNEPFSVEWARSVLPDGKSQGWRHYEYKREIHISHETDAEHNDTGRFLLTVDDEGTEVEMKTRAQFLALCFGKGITLPA